MTGEYCVYILRCDDGSLYTGIAVDAQKRFAEHLSGRGAKYTKTHRPLKIERVWQVNGKSDALKAEYRIKRLTKQEKEKLIAQPDKFLEINKIT